MPILVYANKQDLIGSATSAQIAEGLSLHTIKVRRIIIIIKGIMSFNISRIECGRYRRVQQQVEKVSETGWSGFSKIFLKSEHFSRIEDCDDAFNF